MHKNLLFMMLASGVILYSSNSHAGWLSWGADPDEKVANECDRQISHPNDPKKMAKGVKAEDVILAPALIACTEAKAKNPKTARFNYLLGRVYELSKDNEKAIKMYSVASEQNYAMAQYRLAAIQLDLKGRDAISSSVELYNKAMANGLDRDFVKEAIDYVVFDPNGFKSPLIERIYNKKTSRSILVDNATYLYSLLELLYNEESCRPSVDFRMLSELKLNVMGDVFGKMLGGGVDTSRMSPGQAINSGARAGIELGADLSKAAENAQSDANLLYSRTNCEAFVYDDFMDRLRQAWSSN